MLFPVLLIAAAAGGVFLARSVSAKPVSKLPPAPPAPVRRKGVTSRDTLLYSLQDVTMWATGSSTAPPSATLPYVGKQVPKGIVVNVWDDEAPVPPMFWSLPKVQGWHYVFIDGDVADTLFGGPVMGFLPPHSLENE